MPNCKSSDGFVIVSLREHNTLSSSPHKYFTTLETETETGISFPREYINSVNNKIECGKGFK